MRQVSTLEREGELQPEHQRAYGWVLLFIVRCPEGGTVELSLLG